MKIWPSEHFAKQWRARVGGDVPSPATLGRLVREAVYCQKQRDLYTTLGRPYRVLAVYWHPELNLILKIDHAESRAVTVLTPETRERRG